MPKNETFSTKEAAAYLGVTFSTIQKYLYRDRTLKADKKIGPALEFSRETLDKFRQRRRAPGRPRKAV